MKRLFIVLLSFSFCFAGLNKSISFSRDKIKISDRFKANDGSYYKMVRYANEMLLSEEGKPQLPVIYKQYIISVDESPADVIQSVKNRSYEIQLNAKLLPAQKDIFDPEYSKSNFVDPISTIYDNDEYFPKNIIEIVDDGWFDGNRIVQLAFYPIQYLPKENKLLFHENIDFELITKAGSNKPNSVENRSKCAQNVYNSALKMVVDNDEDIMLYQEKPGKYLSKTSADSADIEYYDYVIITKDSLISAFDDFVEWKKRKGIDIGVVDVDSIISAYPNGDELSGIDDDAGSVRQYLINAYENGTVYVLIGGDDEVVPVRECKRDHNPITDLYYAELTEDWDADGDGLYAEYPSNEIGSTNDYEDIEIFVGRITANKIIEINNWVSKLLVYEQDPGRGDPSYLTNAFFTQADTMQYMGQVEWMESFMDTIGFTFTLLGEVPSYNSLNPISPTSQSVVDELNTPYGLNSLVGHGSRFQISVRTSGNNNEGVDTSQTMWDQVTTFDNEPGGSNGSGFENLTNVCKPAIHFSVSCANCGFDDGFQWYPGDGHQNKQDFSEMYLCYSKAGGVTYLGNTRSAYFSSGMSLFRMFTLKLREGYTHIGAAHSICRRSYGQDISFKHNNFGCPEMPMWTEIPDELSNITISDSSTYITVNTGESDCYVCVSADNPDDYWQADSVLSDTFQTSIRPLHVVVTKKNKLPFINLYGFQNISDTLTLNSKYAYTIRNDITISSTGVLNIESGTTLRFDSGKELKVYGELNIDGTENSPVVLTSDDLNASAGYWDGIRAYSGSELNLNNVQISKAIRNVYADGAKVTIDSCKIEQGTYSGIAIYNATGSNSVSVKNSTIDDHGSYGIYMYNVDGAIERNAISDAANGMYIRGDVTIKYNEISDVTYDGLNLQSYDGNIQFNKISDCRYGIDFMSSSCGDMVNEWATDKSKSTAENNEFSTPMTNCIYISSSATPNIGTTIDYVTDIESGWNVFCNPSNKDIYSNYCGTIKAEGNWWGSSRSIYGSIDYVDIADDIESQLFKRNTIDELFTEVYLLERDSLFIDATKRYLSIIEVYASQNDNIIVQKAMNRMRGCYRKTDAYEELEDVLLDVSNKYSNSFVSALAKNMNSSQYCLKNDYTKALNYLDDAVNEFVELNISESAAFTLLDKFELLQYISDKDDENLNKSLYRSSLENCKNRLLDEFTGTEANVILKEMLELKDSDSNILPESYCLWDPYPNPFNPIVNLSYDLPENTKIRIDIFNIAGQKIRTLVDCAQVSGRYNINYNASHLASGMYIVRMLTPNFTEAKKMLLLK
jgi:hypothetical protein